MEVQATVQGQGTTQRGTHHKSCPGKGAARQQHKTMNLLCVSQVAAHLFIMSAHTHVTIHTKQRAAWDKAKVPLQSASICS